MKKTILFLVLVLSAAQAGGAPFSDPNKKKLTVAATTSNIGEIAKAVGGDKVDVEIMLKPLSCPSNVDITPSMAQRVSKSNLILSHKWEKWVDKLKREGGERVRLFKQAETEGNWMIPYIHIRAAEEIMNMLSYLDIDNAKYYEEKYTRYAYNVRFAGEEARKELAAAYGVKVISNDKIRDFLESFGFEVVAVYGKPEDLTAKKLKSLITEGKKNNVRIVVDNLQAGASTGRELAENLDAKQAVISNFVLGGSFVNTLKDNVSRLKQALK